MIDAGARIPLPERFDVPHLLGDAGRTAPLPWEEMIRLADDRRLFFVVTLACRPGASLFYVTLEHTHFPPKTPANDLFQMAVVDWEGERFLIC